jgi:peptidoglycan/xylan/chitin deacetylase (PgdA/CDA1 family)
MPPPPIVEPRRGIASRVVALTFDDGPSLWTESIAALLERHGGRGTFFAIGEAIDGGGEAIVRGLAQSGHEVGNHTWTHPDLLGLDDDAIRDEMRRTKERLSELGTTPRYWRAPYLRVDGRVRAAVGDMAGREVWYSNVPGDWDLPGEDTAERVLAGLEPGDIVVLHDGRPANDPPELSRPTRGATVEAVGLILEEMTRRGLRAVTISELLASD